MITSHKRFLKNVILARGASNDTYQLILTVGYGILARCICHSRIGDPVVAIVLGLISAILCGDNNPIDTTDNARARGWGTLDYYSAEGREVLGSGSIPFVKVPPSQNMKNVALYLHKHEYSWVYC